MKRESRKNRLCGGALKSLVWGQGRRVLGVMGLERELGPFGCRWRS